MKIALTSTGKTLNSQVDPRFGRAASFIIFDVETGEINVVNNTQNANLPQGAGIQAAQNVSRCGVDYVITGHCGPKAFRTLQSAGIKILVGASGTVGEMIEN